MKAFKKETKVQWQWLGKPINGHVEEVYFESVTQTIKGKQITRHGSPDKPAYLVRSDAGNLALKLHTELKPNVSTKSKFKIFSE